MANGDRPRVSRRRLIAASLGVPAVSMMSPPVMGLNLGSGVSDPIVERAAAWIAEHQRLDALTLEWGNLETQLRTRAGRLGVETYGARGHGLPEAQAMRVLDEKIETSHRGMADLAEAVSLMRAVSVEGALAKVQLGLSVQGRYCWQDHALELLQGGTDELSLLLERGR